MGTGAITSARELLALARKVANSLRDDAPSAAARLSLCRQLLEADAPSEASFSGLYEQLSKLALDHRHYWIGTFYSLLLSPEVRRRQASYFTPPRLADALVELAITQGFDLA